MAEPPVTIVCPSKGRPDDVMTFAAFPIDEVVVVVVKDELEAYKASYPDATFDVLPPTVKGLPATKNWCYEKYGNVFFVDDDVMPMIDLTGGGSQPRVEPKLAAQVTYRLADQAIQMGCYLFGFIDDPVPMHFQPQRPFSLAGPQSGTCEGLLEGSGLWWPDDPKFGPAEDVWIAGLNAYKHRKRLQDLRYAVRDVRGTQGGNANDRSQQMLADMAVTLREAFGEAIVLKDPNDARFYYWRLRVPW